MQKTPGEAGISMPWIAKQWKKLRSTSRYAFFLMRRNPLSLVGGGIVLFLVLLAIIGPFFTPYPPAKSDITSKSLPPSSTHWMGTDNLGMDIFSRVVHAARTDLLIALIGVCGAVAIGTSFGLVSAFYGRWVDEVMMRVLDSLQAFPTIILAMTIAAVLGPSTRNVVIVLVVVNFPLYARLIRSLVLSLKESQYIDAARVVGCGDARLMFRHILPNCVGPIYVQGSLNIGWSVLMAATLSFIGLGTQPPAPEWGVMIKQGARFMILGRWWMAFFPGLFIFLFVLASNLLGDGLQDVLDPKRR